MNTHSHVILVVGLKDSHGVEGTRAHGDVGELVGTTVRVDSEQVRASRVDTADDQMRADVALVADVSSFKQQRRVNNYARRTHR